MELRITVRYSCTLCMLRDRAVSVPARPSEQELMEWMHQMGRSSAPTISR
jgi:hypothetical protein